MKYKECRVNIQILLPLTMNPTNFVFHIRARYHLSHLPSWDIIFTLHLPAFLQQYLVCDHTANVDCGVAVSLYSVNDNFGKVEDDTESPAE